MRFFTLITISVFAFAKLQANYVATCVFWDFALNGESFPSTHPLGRMRRKRMNARSLFFQSDPAAGTQTAVTSTTAQTR